MNKYLLTALVFFLLLQNDSAVCAEYSNQTPLVTMHTVSAKGEQFDFSRFGQAVGDKRIVLLDELSHGEGNVFALKSQIIQYLHQNHGFEVLLLESGLYDVAKITENQQESLKSQAPGNIFYMYANSAAAHGLFDYIDAHRKSDNPLNLAGFDGRLSGEHSLAGAVNELKTFVTSHYPVAHYPQLRDFDWSFFTKQSQLIIQRKAAELSNELSEQQKYAYLLSANQLSDLLGQQKVLGQGYQSSRFWAQLIKGIARVGEQLWGFRRSDENDLIMAQNVQWLLDNVYADKKVVIWGHFVHLNKQGLGPQRYANLGSELQRFYPGQIYTTHFAGAKGRYTDFITMKQKTVQAATDLSFELSLNRFGVNVGFIDSQDVNFSHLDAARMTLWGYDYQYSLPLRQWPALWDGMFYLDTVTPVNYQR